MAAHDTDCAFGLQASLLCKTQFSVLSKAAACVVRRIWDDDANSRAIGRCVEFLTSWARGPVNTLTALIFERLF